VTSNFRDNVVAIVPIIPSNVKNCIIPYSTFYFEDVAKDAWHNHQLREDMKGGFGI